MRLMQGWSRRWAGADTSDGSQFYWNSDVVKIFKDYISVLLNHKNQFTGVSILSYAFMLSGD